MFVWESLEVSWLIFGLKRLWPRTDHLPLLLPLGRIFNQIDAITSLRLVPGESRARREV